MIEVGLHVVGCGAHAGVVGDVETHRRGRESFAPEAVRCVLDFFGSPHVLFGADMPLGPANAIEATIADIDAAGLSNEDMAAVYAGNAARLLGLRNG